MRTLTEEDIRTRAYKLWKAAGEHNTKMDAFWYQAEKELLADRASENSAPNSWSYSTTAQHSPDGRSLARIVRAMRRASACPGRSLTTLRDAADCITALSRTDATSFQVMLPGRKQRIEIPTVPHIGHTMVRPARFGSVITASSGTSIHWPQSRTR